MINLSKIIFGSSPPCPMGSIIFSIDMIVGVGVGLCAKVVADKDKIEHDVALKITQTQITQTQATEITPKIYNERYWDNFIYSVSIKGEKMSWLKRISFVNQISNIIEDKSFSLFFEDWRSAYTIIEEKTDCGAPHVIFLFPQPEVNELPYTQEQFNTVSSWLYNAIEDAKKTYKINIVND